MTEEQIRQEAEEYLVNHFCKKTDELYEYMIDECNSGERLRCTAFDERKEMLVDFANEITKELQESLVEWQKTCEAKSDTNSQLIEQLADKNEQLTEAKEIIAEWEDSFCCGANYLYLGDKGKELRIKSQKFLNNKS